jgi:hypothetical protein
VAARRPGAQLDGAAARPDLVPNSSTGEDGQLLAMFVPESTGGDGDDDGDDDD